MEARRGFLYPVDAGADLWRNRPVRTQANLDLLVNTLLGNCGDFYGACQTAGLSPSFVRKWMSEDKIVKEHIDSAEQVGAMRLESIAIDRAVNGVEKGVWYQGEQVGSETQHSDSLLTLLLKKRLKERYGDEAAQTNVNVNLAAAIQVMPRANSYAEWLEFQRASIERPMVNVTPSLPAPEHDPAMADIL